MTQLFHMLLYSEYHFSKLLSFYIIRHLCQLKELYQGLYVLAWCTYGKFSFVQNELLNDRIQELQMKMNTKGSASIERYLQCLIIVVLKAFLGSYQS